jgi:ribosome-binding factor A
MAILTELNDPRVRDVTVTHVEMTPDMRQAKIHVSVMGDETKQRLSMAGLKSAAGFLQSKVASRIDTRYTPRLEFLLDMGVKKSIAIAEILRRVLPSGPDAGLPQDDELPDGELPDCKPPGSKPPGSTPPGSTPPDDGTNGLRNEAEKTNY